MSSESVKRALKTLTDRRERAVLEANRRSIEVCRYFPRIGELTSQLSRTGEKIAKAVFAESGGGKQAIEKIMLETTEIRQEIAYILTQNGLPADYLEVHFTCPECEDTGYIEGKKCNCLRELIIQYNAMEFNEAAHAIPAAFDNFSLQYYGNSAQTPNSASPRRTMEAILAFCTAYANGFHSNSPSVMMMGDTGLGKTHLSLAIANRVMERGYSVVYTSAPDLFRKLQNEFYGKGEPGANTMDVLMVASLLIIDDLGAELENQFVVSTLYNIVNTRLNAGRPVIISTNLTPKELEGRYSNRIASRLMTMYKCLKFVGKDIRQIKLKNDEL